MALRPLATLLIGGALLLISQVLNLFSLFRSVDWLRLNTPVIFSALVIPSVQATFLVAGVGMCAYGLYETLKKNRGHALALSPASSPLINASIRSGSRLKICKGPSGYQLEAELLWRFENTSPEELILRHILMDLRYRKWLLWKPVPIKELSNYAFIDRSSTLLRIADIKIARSVTKWSACLKYSLPIDPSELSRSYQVRLLLSFVGIPDRAIIWPIDWALAIRTLDPETLPRDLRPENMRAPSGLTRVQEKENVAAPGSLMPTPLQTGLTESLSQQFLQAEKGEIPVRSQAEANGITIAAKQIQDNNKALSAHVVISNIRKFHDGKLVTTPFLHSDGGQFSFHAIQLERVTRHEGNLHYGQEGLWWLVSQTNGKQFLRMFWPDRPMRPTVQLPTGRYVADLLVWVGNKNTKFQAAWDIDAQQSVTISEIDHT